MYPDEHVYHMLFMYFPFRNEIEIKFNSSCAIKLSFPGVLDTIKFNKHKVDSCATIVGKTSGNYAELNNEVWNLKDEGNYLEPKTQTLSEGISFGNQRVPIFTDNVINENIR